MFIVFVNYLYPIETLAPHRSAHLAHLQTYYDRHLLLASGRRKDQKGGIILANFPDENSLWEMIQKDIFYQKKLASFEIIAFEVALQHPCIIDFLKSN